MFLQLNIGQFTVLFRQRYGNRIEVYDVFNGLKTLTLPDMFNDCSGETFLMLLQSLSVSNNAETIEARLQQLP